jgi:hypothetical protein
MPLLANKVSGPCELLTTLFLYGKFAAEEEQVLFTNAM